MQRVVRAVHSAHQRNGEVRLRLSPPELGSLRIELRVEMGVMTARVEAETPETRSLLLDGLPQLRERLAEQGVRVERFDVDLLDRQGEQSPQGTTDNDSQEQQSPNRRAATEPSSQRASTSPSPTSSGRPNDDGKLNVLI
jgi:flagellar hook-length control protein FliK